MLVSALSLTVRDADDLNVYFRRVSAKLVLFNNLITSVEKAV